MLRFLCLTVCLLWSALSLGQSEDLARNYFDQGAFEKSAATYKILVEQNPQNTNYIIGLVQSYQQLEQYDKAEEELLKIINSGIPAPHMEIELGYNYQLQGQNEKAQELYSKAISSLSQNPRYAYAIGRIFEKYSLLDQAVTTYNTAMDFNDQLVFDLELARIYGEQGDIEKMLDTYIALIKKDEKYYPSAQRTYSQFITEDPANEANIIFKKLVIKRLQKDPDLIYNRLLSWLFIQQKEFKKAFLQEKAIYKRSDGNIQGLLDLVQITIEENNTEISEEILEFIISSTPNEDIKLIAEQKLLQLRVKFAATDDYESIQNSYDELIEKYGRTVQTLSLQLEYAHFLAFNQYKKEDAINYLRQTLDLQLSRFQEARTKMELADILVLDEKFNSALIYYSQVQKKVQNDVLAQEARFKVAKTSYYKGDFEWAQTQLKVLKSSATQLIANDAQELYLLIADNSLEDSTQTALKLFARADLLAFQNKPTEAITTYDKILTDHKGESIEDEALLAQAKLYELNKEFEKAKSNYLDIIQFYGEDILADDAYFRLGNLYADNLQQPEKAKEYYEQIIFNFADSIFYVEAQKKYRMLRGDAIN